MPNTKGLSIQMIRRLPKYHAIIEQSVKDGANQISSGTIADYLHLEPIVVRKDLEQIGATGKPRLGFDAKGLMTHIEEFMGWNVLNEVVLVGCGSLGAALLGYPGFARCGFEIVAGFDNNPDKIGTTIHDKKILPVEKLSSLCQRLHIEMGIITTPPDQAQSIADVMVNSGIKGIWNFSPAVLKVPKTVMVQQEDLISSLVILQKKLQESET